MPPLKKSVIVAFFTILLAASAFAADDNKSKARIRADIGAEFLNLNIAPFSTPKTLYTLHKPLKAFMEKHLETNVVIGSAKDHATFLKHSLNGDFQLVLTPVHFVPHLADAGYKPIARYKKSLDLIIVVSKNSKANRLSDLKGKRIGLPDFLSIYCIVGADILEKREAELGDYKLVHQASHTSGLYAVTEGIVDAMITGTPPLRSLPMEIQQKLITIDFDKTELPGLYMMAQTKLGEKALSEIQSTLLAFNNDVDGKSFMETMNYGGFIAADERDIKAGEIYKPLVQKMLIEDGI
ncbi:MAG: phosphate/phosphite/phosphonate ABC transporter substrate-binding protein [Helicobacteraceae bacterium]|jgi:ABC-type phosphate/phosphonate transport system substrate-binding protein|nr:phosphate/phosphite/phosphonate ABC transporter substrate-binding protein [Helicobacteraceae bacterium]